MNLKEFSQSLTMAEESATVNLLREIYIAGQGILPLSKDPSKGVIVLRNDPYAAPGSGTIYGSHIKNVGNDRVVALEQSQVCRLKPGTTFDTILARHIDSPEAEIPILCNEAVAQRIEADLNLKKGNKFFIGRHAPLSQVREVVDPKSSQVVYQIYVVPTSGW